MPDALYAKAVSQTRQGNAAAALTTLRLLLEQYPNDARVDDALWAALRAHFTEEQLVELVALAGFYHLISFVANALRIPLEPFGARLPRPADERRSPLESPRAGS